MSDITVRKIRFDFPESFDLAGSDDAFSQGLSMLEFETVNAGDHVVTPNDVSDLASLIVEELVHLHRHVPDARIPVHAYYPGRRFPAHVFQRVGLLEAILKDLADAADGAPAAREE